MKITRTKYLAIVLALIVLPTGQVHAQNQTVAFDATLRRGFESTQTWRNVSALALTGILFGQGVAVPFSNDSGTRKDLYVGTIAAFAGLVGFLAQPYRILTEYRALENNLRDQRVSAQQIANEKESILKHGAEDQANGRGWLAHIGNLVFNLGASLPLGLAFGRWTSSAISMGAGLVIGEAIIWTQPTNLMTPSTTSTPRANWRVTPTFSKNAQALVFTFRN